MVTETSKLHRQQLDQIATDVADIKELLTGNGDPSKGIVVRLDRLEQSDQRRTWLSRVAISSSIAALFGVIVKWFAH